MLRVAYINIEFDRHLDRVVSFLKNEQPEVVFLNELLEIDVPLFERELGMHCFFTPQTVWNTSRGKSLLGHGVFTALPAEYSVSHYAGTTEVIDATHQSFVEQVPLQRYALVVARITKEDTTYTLGLTHFPWTPDGEASMFQRDALPKLLSAIHDVGDMALFGDFNAPRGKEIFAGLSAKLNDNIPLSYQTSLDENLHRVGKEKFLLEKMNTYMVDGCFTTPGYHATNVRLQFGVSDHAAVIADIAPAAV